MSDYLSYDPAPLNERQAKDGIRALVYAVKAVLLNLESGSFGKECPEAVAMSIALLRLALDKASVTP